MTWDRLYRVVRGPWPEWFQSAVRLGLGCLFVWSGIPKIRQPYDFLSSVYTYELVGPQLGMLVAIVLPWLELLVGVCLVGGVFVGGALLTCTGMATMFTFVIASGLHRGLRISCGCFSASGGGVIDYLTLIRAVAILLVSMIAYFCMVGRRRGAAISGSRTIDAFDS